MNRSSPTQSPAPPKRAYCPRTHFMQFKTIYSSRRWKGTLGMIFPLMQEFPNAYKFTLNDKEYIILYLRPIRCLYVCWKCPCWVTEHMWKRFFSVTYVDIIG